MIYDSPRSYQPDDEEDEVEARIARLTSFSDSILRRGAKTGSTIYRIPPLVEPSMPMSSISSFNPMYNQTTYVKSASPSLELAWAAVQRYRVLVLTDQNFLQCMYQTNVRAVRDERSMFKGATIFLDTNGQFLPPRNIDILYSPNTDEDQPEHNFLVAAQYDVVIVDVINDPDHYAKYPGLIPIIVEPFSYEPGINILRP